MGKMIIYSFMGELRWKRIYDTAEEDDGFRILIDRLWPRGISKADAQLGAWARDVAPSAALRSAFHRNETDYKTFAESYEKELQDNDEMTKFIEEIKNKLKTGNVTLLYASREPEHSQIPVLRSFIEKRLKE
jgi:uroporphyrinogen-III C-methyltransferase